VQLLGYYFGEPSDMMLPQPCNPDGFWERLDVMQINDQILFPGQSSWDWPQRLQPDYWEKGRLSYHLEWIEKARCVLQNLEKRSPWAIKDPRFCLTLPFWQSLAPSMRCIVCLRNPFEVAWSLGFRHRLTENYGLQLWQVYYENLLAATVPGQRLIVKYQDVLDRSEEQLYRLIKWLKINPSEQAIETALSVIDASKRHQQVDDFPEPLGQSRNADLKDIYRKLGDEAQAYSGAFPASDCSPPPNTSDGEAPMIEDQSLGGGFNLSAGEQGERFHISTPGNDKIPQADAKEMTIVPPQTERKVVVYYHLYMNAGASIDHILRRSFGDKGWMKWEGNGIRVNPHELAEFILARPEISAISSHVAVIKLPKTPGVRLYPIVFLRHPLDRVASVYNFERNQPIDAPSANQAKKLDLADFVEWHLSTDRLFTNFQTTRLAAWATTPDNKGALELTRALEGLSEVPYFGIVERFEESLVRLEGWLKTDFPEFSSYKVRADSTSDAHPSIEERLEDLRGKLGNPLYCRLVEANCDDLILYNSAIAKFEACCAGNRELP
jgi:hypothetical protein